MTFKNAEDLRNTVKMVPHDRLLIETDSPFLAPIPMRGKMNEPAFVEHVFHKVHELIGDRFDSKEALSSQLWANSLELFKL